MAIESRKRRARAPRYVSPAMTGSEGETAAPHGASLMDLISSLEENDPELAALAPMSSAAVEAGELVRAVRLAANMPQKRLAEAAGLSQPALSAVERGEGKDGPTYRTLRDLARALGLRIAFVPAAAAAEAPEERPRLARRQR